MIFRVPKLRKSTFGSSSFEMLQEAFGEYKIHISESDQNKEIGLLKIDDIDFVEALELVENLIEKKIKIRYLGVNSRICDLIRLIDEVRSS